VDIILGGNPEGLAKREATAQGVDLSTEEGAAELQRLQKEFDTICEQEGEEVRAIGGLYVLGSERHESRRIDNQLRGRSGRQGDPGESRFFLSLEDDLMRLFATGAMNWVMGRALPDDVPIEAKMVTKAIERAQNTVEGRNAESRKDVLKYDDVMNEQRKVMYGRRQQVIDGEDIHDATIEMIEQIMTEVVEERLAGEFAEEWDVNALLVDLQNYYPTRLTFETLDAYDDREEIVALVLEDALSMYDEKCENYIGGLDTAKEIERDVMLQILDQRWRDHLSDMDYLRDGIHLRQVAQQDPLTAWQKEGYLMFEHLLVEHGVQARMLVRAHCDRQLRVEPVEEVGAHKLVDLWRQPLGMPALERLGPETDGLDAQRPVKGFESCRSKQPLSGGHRFQESPSLPVSVPAPCDKVSSRIS